ncbi:Uncharacterised protein [uncultured archaeon]|nr:Uncharacterised protein [uncultured archaeon]
MKILAFTDKLLESLIKSAPHLGSRSNLTDIFFENMFKTLLSPQ